MPIDFAVVRERARGQWAWLLPALGVGEQHLRNRHGPCPGCQGTDRFRWDDRDGAGTWVCGAGGDTQAGDGFGLLQHVHGWAPKDAFARVAEVLGIAPEREATAEERAAWRAQREAAEQRAREQEQGLALLQELELLAAVQRRRWGDEAGLVASAPAEVDTRARSQWGTASAEVPADHAYLARKQVGAYGLRYRADHELLLVPMRDLGGRLVGIQYLAPDGTKTYLAGTPKRGAMHLFGGLEARPIWHAATGERKGWREDVDGPAVICIGEGYATVAAVHACMGWGAAVAFDCGNLAVVARAVAARWPQAWPIILGDYDVHAGQIPGEPGVAAAVAAAEVCGGVAVWPEIGDGQSWDWDDVLCREGPDALRELLGARLAMAKRVWANRVQEAGRRVRALVGAHLGVL